MPKINDLKSQLKSSPKKWLVTGVAGFIGSNLLEELLHLDQTVVGVDNFSTGKKQNLEEVKEEVGDVKWKRFRFLEADIRNLDDCLNACDGIDYILHQAALGSVPRSIDDPIRTNQSNIDGFLNILVAAKEAKVTRFVYAASSSTYGDHQELPKIEDRIGRRFNMEEALALLEGELREQAAETGADPETLETTLTEKQVFTMIRGYSTTGQNIRLKMCVAPGLIPQWKGGEP